MGTGFYHTLGFRKKSTIGGKHRHKILLTGYLNKFRQMGMQERFAHQMEIEKLDMPFQPVCQQVKFVLRKRPLRAFCLWAELAVQVADIGDLKVTS
jgi:hypothetical protein